jgi:HPt (histidine-containing phosphotransfer) domain-containing protein
MVSDRAACLAAGMNEHVGKPFDLDHLVGLLQRLTGHKVSAGERPLPRPAGAEDSSIELDAALRRLGGRRDVYRRLLGNLVADLGHWPGQWRALAASGCAEELRRQAHALKGVAATLGAGQLSAQAAAAENALAGGPTSDAVESSLNRLLAAMAEALPALSRLAAQLQDAAPAADGGAPAEPLDALLHTLGQRLAEDDMDAQATLERLRTAHGERLGERLVPLEQAIGQLDFRNALVLCRALQADGRA